MNQSQTTRIFTIGAQGTKSAWTTMAHRSRLEQILMLLLGLIVVVPLFLLLLGLGAVVALFALVTGLIMLATAKIRRLIMRSPDSSMRENVRVISPNRSN